MLLIGNVLKPLAKIVLIPLGLTAAAHAAIHKKMFGYGCCPTDLALHLLDFASPQQFLIEKWILWK